MKYSFAIFLLFFLLSTASAYGFQDYIKQFNKTYQNETELEFRREIFNANYSKILENNQDPTAIPQAPTKWTDRTLNETQFVLSLRLDPNIVPDPFPVSDGKLSAPTSVDWRTSKVVTIIKDQGWCGSCWAFATTACYESYLAIKNKTTLDLAQQSLLQCTSGCSCLGGDITPAMVRAKQYGLPSETTYPYTAKYTTTNTYKAYSGICSAAGSKPSAATKVYTWYGMSAAQIQERVAQSPVVIAIYASNAFMNFRSSAVFSCGRVVYNWELNHAVLLIGYDSSGNYIIKNSWGPTWGNQGYALLHKTYSCGVGLYVSQFSELKLAATNTTAKQLTTGLSSVRVYLALALMAMMMMLC